KIADFGFGRAMTTVPPRDSKGLVRRVLYTAPEVIAGHPYTAKSDIFALGLMLYEMLVGTHPYLGASADQVYQRASQGAIPPLHEHVLLPRPLAKLIESMLAPEPARRIYSAGSIYEQLTGYIFDHNLMADARTLAAFVQDVHKDERQHFSEETPLEVGLEEIALDDVLIPEASPPFAQDPSSAGARFTGEPMPSEQPSLPGRLEEYFAATCAGRGKAVLLHGHLGAGREYLPDRLPDVLELRGSTLAFCAQLTRDDTHRPFGALGDIVLQSMHALVPEDTPVAPYSAIAALKSLGLSSEARDTLAGLWHIGEPSRAGYREQRAHLEEVCTRVLVELCKRTTVVCAIDRVELLDPLSMDIVRSLLSTISSLPAMLLLSTLHVERAAKALDTSNPEHLRTIRVVGSTPQSSPRLAASSPTPPTS
ncbi:MAG: protein kinase, partial [Myxococcota bacterium]